MRPMRTGTCVTERKTTPPHRAEAAQTRTHRAEQNRAAETARNALLKDISIKRLFQDSQDASRKVFFLEFGMRMAYTCGRYIIVQERMQRV